MDNDLKHCGNCATDLPRSSFNKNKRQGDGLGSQCRVCARASVSEHRAKDFSRRDQLRANPMYEISKMVRYSYRNRILKTPSILRHSSPYKRNALHKLKAHWHVGQTCVSCGISGDDTGSLHYHHIDPSTKSFSIGDRWTSSWEILVKELDKCNRLCADCHYKEHDFKRK